MEYMNGIIEEDEPYDENGNTLKEKDLQQLK
jgi:hypothetical protein